VVEVDDRRSAPGSAASIVAQNECAPEGPRERTRAAIDRVDVSGDWIDEDAPEEHPFA